MATFKRQFLIWIWNLVNAVVSGSATAAVAAASGQMIGAVTFTWRQLMAVAMSGGAISAFNYVRENRLPQLYSEGDPE